MDISGLDFRGDDSLPHGCSQGRSSTPSINSSARTGDSFLLCWKHLSRERRSTTPMTMQGVDAIPLHDLRRQWSYNGHDA
jgi:hypothetical protein